MNPGYVPLAGITPEMIPSPPSISDPDALALACYWSVLASITWLRCSLPDFPLESSIFTFCHSLCCDKRLWDFVNTIPPPILPEKVF